MPAEVKEVIGPYIANVERELEQGRAPEGFPVPVEFQGANGTNGTNLGNDLMRGIGLQGPNGQNGNGQATTAGGILDRFLGTNPPATGTPGGQLPPPGATNTWYGNDILPLAPLPGTPQPIPKQPAPSVPSGIPVLPPLPF
jgi:hypothetical protein